MASVYARSDGVCAASLVRAQLRNFVVQMSENIRVLRREERSIHLDFSACRTANDSFVKAFIEKAGDKLVGLECPGLPITKK
eukprot:8777529-Pyramimonas_sp.AAC.1